jgi:hypothetical protein
MGQVYLGQALADPPGAGRAVAVKVVHEQYTADRRIRERFAREIATARAPVAHPLLRNGPGRPPDRVGAGRPAHRAGHDGPGWDEAVDATAVTDAGALDGTRTTEQQDASVPHQCSARAARSSARHRRPARNKQVMVDAGPAVPARINRCGARG